MFARTAQLFLFIVAFQGVTLRAATFTKLDLLLEAYVNPIADILEVDVLLSEKEKEATVDLRAFIVTGKSDEILTPVKASDYALNSKAPTKHFDSEKNYFNTTIVDRIDEIPSKSPLTAAIKSTSYIIAYRDLKLEPGEYKLGFEVKLKVDGKVVATERTALSHVKVTQEARKQISFPFERELAEGEKLRDGESLVNSAETRDEEGAKRIGRSIVTVDLLEPVQPGIYRSPTAGWTNSGLGRIQEFVAKEYKAKPSNDVKPPKIATPWEPVSGGHILFATNRNLVSARKNDASRYGKTPDLLRMGISFFDIPVDVHKMGMVELPNGNKADPKKHFILRELFEKNEEAFFNKEITDRVGYDSDDVLVYVHGFNNNYEFASLKMMQMVNDIRFQGIPIAYIWPSAGELSQYRNDEKSAEASWKPLADFLVKLSRAYDTKKHPGKIHIIAHSMGNRVMLNAVASLKNKIEGKKPFGNIILAAADVDLTTFNAKMPAVVELSETVYNYHCVDDRALIASRTLHLDKRVGEGAVPFQSVINIDAKNANTSIIGHDYYAAKSPLLYDLDLVINKRTPPEERVTIRKRDREDLGITDFYFP